MGPILSEPIEEVVEIPKVLIKMSVGDAKNTRNAKSRYFPVFSPRAAPGIQIDENRENKEKTGRIPSCTPSFSRPLQLGQCEESSEPAALPHSPAGGVRPARAPLQANTRAQKNPG
jgi:hypothetical protein